MRTMLKVIAACGVFSAALNAQERWTGRVDLAIGGPDETRDAYMFNVIGGIATDAAGRILVADPQTSAVRVFGADGTHLFSFGRKGAGPGDLNSPCCVTLDANGRVWIRERGNNRHSIFSVDGEGARFITSYPVRAGSGPPDRINWDDRGYILYLTTESRSGPIRTVRFHADSTGKEMRRDTLSDPPVDSATRVWVNRIITGGRSTYSTVVNHTPQFLRGEGRNGQLAEANSARYEVQWLDGDLKLLRTIRGEANPPAVSAREKAAAREAIAEFAKRMQADVDLDAVKYPARKPALNSLGFDLDGRLWVERSVADGQPRAADVYDGNGRLVARATWPADVGLRYSTVKGTSGLGIRVDDDTDVWSVVRVRFRP